MKCRMSALRFAVIGLNHDHIYGQVDVLLRAGAELRRLPRRRGRPRGRLRRRVFRRPSASPTSARSSRTARSTLIVSAAISSERAGVAHRGHAARQGRDARQAGHDHAGSAGRGAQGAGRDRAHRLDPLFRAFRDRARPSRPANWSQAGAIGEVIHTIGLGPHRLRKPTRPDWFFDRERYGGILTDIASHQCEQFLFFAGSLEAEVLSATVAQPRQSRHARACRISATSTCARLTSPAISASTGSRPTALPTWGDGRLFIVGTEGTIELRKYIDVAGRPGTDHLFLDRPQGHAAYRLHRPSSCPMAGNSSPISATAPKRRWGRTIASRPWSWR